MSYEVIYNRTEDRNLRVTIKNQKLRLSIRPALQQGKSQSQLVYVGLLLC